MPLAKGLRIEEGFQGRAGLTQRSRAIDVGCAGQITAGTDPNQDFAAVVVDNQHGPVLDLLRT